MRIESAIEHGNWLEVIIDGRRFRVGEKYTILELGYAVYLMEQNDDDWLQENGDAIPSDPIDNCAELRSGHKMFITADPVLVALAIESWWSRNGMPQPQDVPLSIPTAYEAVEIVRNRKILNDFNKRFAGFVPGLEIIAKRGRKINQAISQQKPRDEIDKQIKHYKTDLNKRYWNYQRSQFPDWKIYFERPFAEDGRPPVFLPQQANKNIIFNPREREHEVEELFKLIPNGEHHKWFRSMNSSQALAQSILGNLAISDSLHFLSELKDDDGLDLFGKAQISSDNFSMEHKIKYLREPRSTSLDSYISGDYRIAIECKFTEAEVGTCSRPRLTPADSNYEKDHCNGTYIAQRARKNRCSLTEIGVQYWLYVPSLFNWKSENDLDPCPLNKNYQLVRNILAIGVKPDGSVSLNDGHVIMIYDERNPAFQANGEGLKAYIETRNALREQTMLRKCSWQRIVQQIREKVILPWLTQNLDLKYGL